MRWRVQGVSRGQRPEDGDHLSCRLRQAGLDVRHCGTITDYRDRTVEQQDGLQPAFEHRWKPPRWQREARSAAGSPLPQPIARDRCRHLDALLCSNACLFRPAPLRPTLSQTHRQPEDGGQHASGSAARAGSGGGGSAGLRHAHKPGRRLPGLQWCERVQHVSRKPWHAVGQVLGCGVARPQAAEVRRAPAKSLPPLPLLNLSNICRPGCHQPTHPRHAGPADVLPGAGCARHAALRRLPTAAGPGLGCGPSCSAGRCRGACSCCRALP